MYKIISSKGSRRTSGEFSGSRKAALLMVSLMIFASLAGMATASLSPEIYTNMKAYYNHEHPELLEDSTYGEETSSRDDSRAIVKSFSISISLAWDATLSDFQTWDNEFKNGNKALYDGTDGQMVFSKVDIYNNKAKWSTVDYHINNANGRAYTYRGGIQYGNIYIELYQNDAPMSGKVVVHEFGHYGLFLPDEYTDSTGPFCTSLMGSTYDTKEFCSESNHCDLDPTNCATYGETDSCWRQMANRFPGLVEKDPPTAGPFDAPTPKMVWHFPDLYTDDSKLKITPADPKDGEEVTLDLDILNKENLVNKNVDVSFYDGYPSGGTLIDTKSTFISGYLTTVSTKWTATAGSHTISAVIDPNDIINEGSESNNTAQQIVDVNAPPEISSSLTTLTASEDQDLVVDLSKYENDREDGGPDAAELKWSVTDQDHSVIKAISGEGSDDDVLTFKVAPDWNGVTTVELTLTDSVGLSSSKDVDLKWNSINDAPVVQSLTPSLTSIFRTESLELTMTGSDVEDGIDALTPEIEYKPAELDYWSPTTVTTMSDTFESTLISDTFFQAGFYDIRGRLTDQDSLSSDWLYSNSSIEIKNNLPSVEDVTFGDGADGIYRTNPLTIFVSGMDLETPVAYLNPIVQYSICDEEDWTPIVMEDAPEFDGEYWNVIFTPDADMETGDYCFMVQMEDENDGLSKFYLTEGIPVLNNKPEVTSITLSETSVLRSDFMTVTVEGQDLENLNSDKGMLLEINYKTNGGAWEAAFLDPVAYESHSNSWDARFLPPMHAKTGQYIFSARLTDVDGDPGEWFESTDHFLDVKNNEPMASIAPLKTMTEGKAGTFDASGSSDLEDPGLTYSWDFGDKKTARNLKPSHTYAKAGRYTVTLTVTDSDGGEATATAMVTVNEASIFNPGGGSGTSSLGATAIAGILAIIIIVVILTAFIIMRKRRSENDAINGPTDVMPSPANKGYQHSPWDQDPNGVKYDVEMHKMQEETVISSPAYGEETKEKFYK